MRAHIINCVRISLFLKRSSFDSRSPVLIIHLLSDASRVKADPPLSADGAGRSSLDVEGALFPPHDDRKTEDQETVDLPFTVDLIALDDNARAGQVGAMSDNELDDLSTQSWLQWKDGAGSLLRKAHNATGRSTFFAKQREKRRMVEFFSGCKNILH